MHVGNVRVVSRTRAGLRAPRSVVALRRPAPHSWIHHTAAVPDSDVTKPAVHREPTRSEKIFFRAMCRYWREVQSYHMDIRQWVDVGYNFGIAPGLFGLRPRIFVGRGATAVGAHTEGVNSTSIGIVVFGNNPKLSRATRRRIRRLLDELVRLGFLTSPRFAHPTGGHQEAPGAATACPGSNVMQAIPELRRRVTSG